MDTHSDKSILLFDGVCNLCNGIVNFVIAQDKKQLFYFASLQSEFGQKILIANKLPLSCSWTGAFYPINQRQPSKWLGN
jgi:predicted DCC family thiol-disulfide oxidoreductase YuxK